MNLDNYCFLKNRDHFSRVSAHRILLIREFRNY